MGDLSNGRAALYKCTSANPTKEKILAIQGFKAKEDCALALIRRIQTRAGKVIFGHFEQALGRTGH